MSDLHGKTLPVVAEFPAEIGQSGRRVAEQPAELSTGFPPHARYDRMPREFWAGWFRVFQSGAPPAPDPLEVFKAFAEVDESGAKLPVRQMGWCPRGARFRVRA